MRVESVLERLGIEFRVNGLHLAARCPYHEDKNPSWRIRRSGDKKGLHYCQACKEGGNLVELVMHVRGYVTYGAAKDWLERHDVGRDDLEVPDVTVKIMGQTKLELPVGVVCDKPFSEWPGPPRQELEKRGVTRDQVEQWSLAYAVEGKLAGRVVIPVYDRHGTLVSYMARSFGDHPRKYLYPDEEDGPDRDVLFGEEVWPSMMRKEFTVVVTEGGFKTLAVERALVNSIMPASLGGSPVPPRPAHVAKLASFGRVIVFTDNDPAGNRCGDNLELVLAGHTKVNRAKLPPGKDPDGEGVTAQEIRDLIYPLMRT